MRRKRVLGIVLAIAILSSLIGWYIGKQVQSPEDRAASTASPEPSLLTAPVERRELSQEVILRGEASSSSSVAITPSAADGSEAIITGVLKEAGDTVSEGDIILEVSGRPLFVLEGELPAFRSYVPGLKGPDVLQLEESLRRLGFNPGVVDDVYDTATATAVEALYESKGYRAATPAKEDKESLRAVQMVVDEQKKALKDLQNAISSDGSATQKLQLEQSVKQAENALSAAIRDAEIAKDQAVSERQLAAQELAAAQVLLDKSPKDADLQNAFSQAESRFLIAKKQANNVAASQDAFVEEARASVVIAKSELSDQETNSSSESDDERIATAKDSLAQAEQDLEDLKASIGTSFPSTEVIFVRELSQEVSTVAVSIGDAVSGTAMTISGSDTFVRSSVSQTDRKLLAVGDEAVLEQSELGFSMNAKISKIASEPGGEGVSGTKYAINLDVLEEDIPSEILGQSLRITVPVSASDGEVLVVPLAAVSSEADGSVRVDVEVSEGVLDTVEVASGLSAGGFLEVSSVDGQLSEGDRVVVGKDLDLSSFSSSDS